MRPVPASYVYPCINMQNMHMCTLNNSPPTSAESKISVFFNFKKALIKRNCLYCLFWIVHCGLSIVDYLLWIIVDYLLWIVGFLADST